MAARISQREFLSDFFLVCSGIFNVYPQPTYRSTFIQTPPKDYAKQSTASITGLMVH